VVATFAVGGCLLLGYDDGRPLDTLGGMIIVDGFSVWMRLVIFAGLLVSTLLSVSWLKENQVLKFEIPLLYLLSGVGMLFMVSANNLLALYVSLELSSLCLYVLAAVRRIVWHPQRRV
jgi:NADH-quinone oxidoreductase subunit N